MSFRRLLLLALAGGLILSVAGRAGLSSSAVPALAAQPGDTPALAIAAVIPAEFNGNVNDLAPGVEPHPITPGLKGPPPNFKSGPTGIGPSAINVPLAPMPATTQNFAGMSRTDICTGGQCGTGWPPDINGDVGANHYIEAVNSAYAIYSKTGTLLASFTENSLWTSGGVNACNGQSRGDPVVLYDTLSDRWILTHFAFASSGGNPVSPFYECIAASKTNDPVAGGWWLYAIRVDTGATGQPPVGTMGDYPHFGLWTDCLYMSANGFLNNSFNGTAYASFSRSDMFAGLPLTGALGFIANAIGPFTMIPSNLRASSGVFPPANTPNYFVSESTTAYNFEVRKFTAGANCGTGGALGAPALVSQTSYSVPTTNTFVTQPGTTNLLDALTDRLLQQVQYRRVGSAESLWVVHTVQPTAGATARPQWAQIDVTGGVVAATPVQQQIYSPDTTLHRWMASIAADRQGNVAMGYSTSNGTAPNYPSIAYAGRLAGDPLNDLPRSEVQIIAGSASQTNECGGNPCRRWGDYTAMSIDPVDDCTFWYTNEYYSSTVNGSTGNWQTRIASFKFPGCVAPAPTISTMSPNTLPAGSAQFTLTVNGTNFTTLSQIKWNGVALLPTTFVNTTQLRATVPAGNVASAGTPPVTVLNPDAQVTPALTFAVRGRTAGDYDGDGKTDLSVYRPSTNAWFVSNSAGGSMGAFFGIPGDQPVPGDYDGDGKTDMALYRPSTNAWFITKSSGGSMSAFFGIPGDVPVPGDYDGDGKTDIAVFRPSTGAWFITRSSGGSMAAYFGVLGDQPVPGDYDGDGKTDMAVYRPSTNAWFVTKSSGGSMAAFFGIPGDVPIPGDYDGDGKTDMALFRPSTSAWFIARSSGGSTSAYFGIPGDVPVPGDYDGDGKTDMALFRPSTGAWFITRSSGGSMAAYYGVPGDTNVVLPYVTRTFYFP